MGHSKKLYEEVMNVQMSKDVWQDCPEYIRQQMTIKTVEAVNVDYSNDEVWQGLKKASQKAYKELKKREYYLNHRKTKDNEQV